MPFFYVLFSNPPQDVGKAMDVSDSAIASTVFASRVTIHQTLGVSPGGLAFQCYMLHIIPSLANFDLIGQQRQTLINYNCTVIRQMSSQRYWGKCECIDLVCSLLTLLHCLLLESLGVDEGAMELVLLVISMMRHCCVIAEPCQAREIE
jgi:hypothetical protein